MNGGSQDVTYAFIYALAQDLSREGSEKRMSPPWYSLYAFCGRFIQLLLKKKYRFFFFQQKKMFKIVIEMCLNNVSKTF